MAKKNKAVEVTQDPMTQFIEKKRPYSDQEIMKYSYEMAEAMEVIENKILEQKEFDKKIKDEIAGQEVIMSDCAARIRQGVEIIPVECTVTYAEKVVTFTEKNTGEIVEQREMTEEEQLRLTDKWVDAERIIREDSKKEK